MNTTIVLDEPGLEYTKTPGEQLARVRQEKGYSIDYVANELNLRTNIIKFIENNEFHLLPPQPVFVIGYLRVYAKWLGLAPEPFIALYNEQYLVDKKPERALLWQQSKRESHKAEHIIRLVTILFALGVIAAVGIWWQKNKDNQQVVPAKTTSVDASLDQPGEETELKLTDISKMQSLLNPKPEMTPLEKTSG